MPLFARSLVCSRHAVCCLASVGLLALSSLTQACDPGVAPAAKAAVAPGEPIAALALDGALAYRAAAASGPLRLESVDGRAFSRAGLRFETAGADPGLEYRVTRTEDGVTTVSPWARVPVRWHEAVAFNGLVTLEQPAERLELRASAVDADAEPSFLFVELLEGTVVAQVQQQHQEPFRTVEQALAPPSYVNLRSAWGARDTGVCGDPHTPQYITIHHTVSPTVDSMAPEQRLRQIQAYHIDTNGWCDLGYHFLVSADGRLWQGRGDHERTGAHVGSHNTNNVGISFMGSFHIDPVPQAMLDGAALLVGWLAENYGISLDRTHILGHREWPGTATECPGGFLLPRLEEIIEKAGTPAQNPAFEVSLSLRDVPGQARDLVLGSSSGVFDALVGQTLTADFVLTNSAQRPATDEVFVGYALDGRFFAPLDAQVLSDAPALDGQSWTTVGGTSLTGPEGNLSVGTLQPGESRRVSLTLQAQRYSFGNQSPAIRLWVQHVGGLYEDQVSWDDPLELNAAGGLLRAEKAVDVFSPWEWQFNGPAGDDLEGWTSNGDIGDQALNILDHALASRVTGAAPQVLSPAWTSIDAATKNQMVLRVRQHGAPREMRLYWALAGQSFDETQSVAFTPAGQGQFEVVQLDLSSTPSWSATVTRLRLDPWEGGSYTGAESWLDVDYVFVSAAGTTADGDGDGVNTDEDCDDTAPDVFPGATESCNGRDDNCDGAIDEGCPGQEDSGRDADAEDLLIGPEIGGKSPGPCDCSLSERSALPSFVGVLILGIVFGVSRRTRQRPQP